jgi:hypothetical protein
VNALVSDDVPAGSRFVADGKVERRLDGLRDFIMQLDLSRSEVDKLKYTIENGKLNVHITPFRGGFKPQDVSFTYGDYQYDLVIVIGVATYSRIEKLYLQNSDMFQNIPLINIDFHRVNENYGAINLIDTNAASLSEMLVALAESLQTGIIDAPIATALLAGIMAATDRFTANHTTPKALTVAAQMMAVGANQQEVVKGLYKTGEKPRVTLPNQSRQEQKSAQPQKEMIAGGRLPNVSMRAAMEQAMNPTAQEEQSIQPAPASNPNPAPAMPQEAPSVEPEPQPAPQPQSNEFQDLAAEPVQEAQPAHNPLETSDPKVERPGINPTNTPNLFTAR